LISVEPEGIGDGVAVALSWLVVHSATASVAVGSGVAVSSVGCRVGDGVTVAVSVRVAVGRALVGVLVGTSVAVGVAVLVATTTGVAVASGGSVGVLVGVEVGSGDLAQPTVDAMTSSAANSKKAGIGTGREIRMISPPQRSCSRILDIAIFVKLAQACGD
jgi:hypothetical protein